MKIVMAFLISATLIVAAAVMTFGYCGPGAQPTAFAALSGDELTDTLVGCCIQPTNKHMETCLRAGYFCTPFQGTCLRADWATPCTVEELDCQEEHPGDDPRYTHDCQILPESDCDHWYLYGRCEFDVILLQCVSIQLGSATCNKKHLCGNC